MVDSSPYVCKWMRKYFAGKGSFQVHQLGGPSLPVLRDPTVDAVVAHGVLQHQDSRHREIFYAGVGWDLTS